MKHIWRIWAKALGEKSGSTDEEADKIACVRTIIVLIYIIVILILSLIRYELLVIYERSKFKN